MSTDNLQKKLLDAARGRNGPNISFSDEIAELLSISTDSAYRRIRGEKALTLEEVEKICAHFKISLDVLMGYGTATAVFNRVSPGQTDFNSYLMGIGEDMKRIAAHEKRKIWYYAKDIPLFHYFSVPEVGAFKVYFWRKTVLGHAEMEGKKFDLSIEDASLKTAGNRLLDIFNAIPSVEIWSEETINSLLHQITYYHEAGSFSRREDAAIMCDASQRLLDHIEAQAAMATKFFPGKAPATGLENFGFYGNEVLVGDNTILVEAGDRRRVYLPHHVLHYLVSEDESFCASTTALLENILRKSIPISGVSEKERNRFFNRLRDRVEMTRKKVS